MLGKYATNVIGTCAFGLKLDTMTDKDNEFRKYGRQIFKPTFRQLVTTMLGLISPKLSNTLKIQQFTPEVIEFFNSIFKEVIEYRETNNVNRNDVAQTLMQARKELVLIDGLDPEGTEYYSNTVYGQL